MKDSYLIKLYLKYIDVAKGLGFDIVCIDDYIHLRKDTKLVKSFNTLLSLTDFLDGYHKAKQENK